MTRVCKAAAAAVPDVQSVTEKDVAAPETRAQRRVAIGKK